MTGHISQSVCYVGWHNQGNVGDDAIREAAELGLAGAEFIDFPMSPRALVTSLASGLRTRLRDSTLVLGGGTCLGRRNWRRTVRLGQALTGRRPGYAIGVGVEDPAFSGFRSYSSPNELTKRPPILRSFDSVSVRGPRSAEFLADVGFDAKIVGDPALILPRSEVRVVPGRIGINLGFGDDLWGHDGPGLARSISTVCKHFQSHGYEIVGIPMNEEDRTWLDGAFHGLDHNVSYLPASNSTEVIAALASCSVAIVSRLHAAILAAVSGTPTVTLEYQPKCRDFALSISNEEFLIRTDRLSTSRVIERTEVAIDERDEVSKRTTDIVNQFRDLLAGEYAAAAITLGLPHA